MRRFAVAALFVLAISAAASAGEGVYITLDGGYGIWNKNSFKQRLNAQGVGVDPVSNLPNADLLVDKQLQDGGLFGLHLGYNIGGHVAFEGSLMLRPYDLLSDTRGGAGIAGMAMRWYPLQGLVRPNRQFDVSFIAGMDYVLSGGNGIHDANNKKLENTGRGFDGTAMELGFNAELYPAKWVSIGLTPRIYLMDPVRFFTSFDNRDQGGAIPLSGSGGVSFFSISLSVAFHFEPLPD
jgi:opacity protein-like surface antigen